MADSSAESLLATTSGLLTYYCYEVGSPAQESLLERWLQDYSPEWVRLALIESLYRGRYKTISVRGLLADWQRRGQPIYHFNREFEALICHDFPQIWFKQDSNAQEEPVSSHLAVNNGWTQQQPATQAPTSLDHSALDANAVVPSSRDVEPFAANHSDTQAPLMSEKLWRFVADVESRETLPAGITSNATGPVGDVPLAREANPRKIEAAPIGQFTPKHEFSELHQKLVSMVSSA